MRTMGGVADKDIILLDQPDITAFEQALAEIENRLGQTSKEARTEVFFYYSGHADERGLLMGDERLPYQTLRHSLDSMRTDVRIAVLDACASGAITRIKGGKRRQAFMVDQSNTMRGYAFLTSSSADESAQESDRIGASFFTHYLVSGMRGAADVSGDGRVTLGEAYQFAFDQTLDQTTGTRGGAQHPAYDISLSGTGDVVITDVRQTNASLALGAALNGRLFVRDSNQRLVAELYKPAGRAVELGLEAGTYSVFYEPSNQLHHAEINLDSGQRGQLDLENFAAVDRAPTRSRGNGEGLAVEVAPDFEIDVGPQGKYKVSLGFFLNDQSEPFNGLQVSLFNRARQRGGSQISPLANLGMADMRGFQLAGIINNSVGKVESQLAGIGNTAGGQVTAMQVAGIGNLAGGTVDGFQLAGIGNIAGKPVGGFQAAGIGNLAGGVVEGFQLAGIGNIGGGQVGGFQAAGIGNIAGGQVKGFQAAGIGNLAGDHVAGGQIAGIFNVAQKVSNLQLAGIGNIANRMQGLQLGLVNITGDGQGAQIGLINLSQRLDGVTLGLLNYSHQGRLDASIWTDSNGLTWFSVSSGSRALYSFYSAGISLVDTEQPYALGLGIGADIPVSQQQHVEVDISLNGVFVESIDPDKGNLLGRMRLLGVHRGGQAGMGFFAGAALDLLWNDDQPRHLSQPGGLTLRSSDEYRLGLGLFAGVRYSR
jgi:hypothetical protein